MMLQYRRLSVAIVGYEFHLNCKNRPVPSAAADRASCTTLVLQDAGGTVSRSRRSLSVLWRPVFAIPGGRQAPAPGCMPWVRLARAPPTAAAVSESANRTFPRAAARTACRSGGSPAGAAGEQPVRRLCQRRPRLQHG